MAAPETKWSANSGFLSSTKLSKELRREAAPIMRFRQFVRKEPALGKNSGDTVNFSRVRKLTDLGTALIEGTPISAQEQLSTNGSLTMTEYGAATSYTGKIEALADHPIESIIMESLRVNMAETLDDLIADQFKAAKVKACPLTATTIRFDTGGTFGAGDDDDAQARVNVNTFHVKECVDSLKMDYNCPPYDGSDYMAIGITHALRGIKDSAEFQMAAKYGDPQRLFDGEVGRWYGTRFIETTRTDSLSHQRGNGADLPGPPLGEMVIFGQDPVIEAVAIEPEIRVDLPTDFGRQKQIAWYSIMGWSITWDVGADAGADPAVAAGPGQARIIHIGSADSNGQSA